MKDVELRRAFRRICQKNGIPLRTDVNGNFFGVLDGEKVFNVFKQGIVYASGPRDIDFEHELREQTMRRRTDGKD